MWNHLSNLSLKAILQENEAKFCVEVGYLGG